MKLGGPMRTPPSRSAELSRERFQFLTITLPVQTKVHVGIKPGKCSSLSEWYPPTRALGLPGQANESTIVIGYRASACASLAVR